MKRLSLPAVFPLALFVASASSVASAQPIATTVADTIYNFDRSLFTGSVIITGSNFSAPGSVPVLGGPKTVRITNGALSVSLIPNDTSSPATTYSFRFSNGTTKYCTVPTSSNPVTMAGANCVDASPATVPALIPLSQLAGGGATVGQALVWNGTQYAPANVSGGAGGWTLNTVSFSATPTFPLASGNIQKITLTGNVTASSITGLATNTVVLFEICQDGTGNHTFAWPASVKGGVVVGLTANTCTQEWFSSTDSTYLRPPALGVINQ